MPILPMHMTMRGRQRLTDREGKRLAAYRDSKGIWTIGVGHTAGAGAPAPQRGMIITAQQCDDLLARDLLAFETIVNTSVRIALADHEFDALVSIAFNIGNKNGKFTNSTFIRRLNAGDRAGCAAHIMDWSKPKEIIGRRHTEQSQFLTAYVLGT